MMAYIILFFLEEIVFNYATVIPSVRHLKAVIGGKRCIGYGNIFIYTYVMV